MKKIFTFAMALVAFAGVAKAATVDDLEPLKHSYVLVADDVTNNGTTATGAKALFGDNHFLAVKSLTTATNKGTVDISNADGTIVTEEMAAKYGEYGAHLNSLRIKNGDDGIKLKLTEGSKLIVIADCNNTTRFPELATEDGKTVVAGAETVYQIPVNYNGKDFNLSKLEITVDDGGTYTIIANGGNQIYISYIIVEANEAPGTPMLKVGDQMYESGLWFKEVTAKAVEAEGYPTLLTYTTDGSTPTAESKLYTGPIKCYQNMVVKFQAFADWYGGEVAEDAILDGADNEAPVNFIFEAPSIEAVGGEITIVSPYESQNGVNFYTINNGEETEGNTVSLTESAIFTAYTKIVNGEDIVFTSKTVTKDIYVLNPIKEKKTITVTAGEAVLDEEATANSTTGPVYKVEGGAISTDKMDFFVKNLEFSVLKDDNAIYQVPEGQEIYIKMNNTNITFQVADGDSVNVKVVCSKNACKNINADDNADDPTALVNDRKCIVNVSGTNHYHVDAEGNEASDMKLCEDANIIEFGLTSGTYTFQKYSGTGNILIRDYSRWHRGYCYCQCCQRAEWCYLQHRRPEGERRLQGPHHQERSEDD